ncbi:MAG: hypothetical protein EBU89_06810 [Actinobacteria bacterium]|nr:hypothetical protein [Actinomycetota bacterium]
MNTKLKAAIKHTAPYAVGGTLLAASLAACTRGISKQQNWARTPYFLLQIFIGISGYTLFSGTFLVYKVAGVIVLVTGVTGFVALFRTPQGN